LLNLYNEKELNQVSSTQSNGLSTIKRSILDQEFLLPFAIAGDFNSHSTWWNSQADINPKSETKELVDWLQKNQCQLLNFEEQTYFRSNLVSQSIIDLAFYSSTFKET
jgi:hypothetical protein